MFVLGVYEFLEMMAVGQVTVERDRANENGVFFSIAVSDGDGQIEIPFDVFIEWSKESHAADGSVKAVYVVRPTRSEVA